MYTKFAALLLILTAKAAKDQYQSPCEAPGVVCGDEEKRQKGIARRWSIAGVAGHQQWRRPNACPRDTDFRKIEPLLPEEHFRGPYNGPMSYFKRVPKHYLGYHVNFSQCRRRVYIDIGAREFDSKEGFLAMLKFYQPLLDFDEYYAFEAISGFYKLPGQQRLQEMLITRGMRPERAATFSRRHFFFQAFIGARSQPHTTPPTIGLSDFLKTALGLQPADAVVIKMDVEGYEYDIVRTLLLDGTHELIDEIMLEVHYGHKRMLRDFKWCKTPQFWCSYTLQNATTMYQALRAAGVYAHHWP